MSTAATVRRAVLFSALEQIAKHHASRDLRVGDPKTKVDLTIIGQVNSFEVKESFAGQLIVGPPSTRSTSVACDQAELLGVLASKLSAKLSKMASVLSRVTSRALSQLFQIAESHSASTYDSHAQGNATSARVVPCKKSLEARSGVC